MYDGLQSAPVYDGLQSAPVHDLPSGLRIRPLPGHAGLALAGDADVTTLHRLHAALATLPGDAAGEITWTSLIFTSSTCRAPRS
jgi:hypothetical protein